MSTGYTRQSAAEIIPSAVVKSSSFNNELNKVRDAFKFSTDGSTGHTHDGSSDEGSYVPLIADVDANNKIVVDGSTNRISFYNEVSSSPVEQVRFEDGVIKPVTDNDVDLGTSTLEFKDLYLDGTAKVDTLTVDENATVVGTLEVTGVITATAGLTGDLTGDVEATGTLTVPTPTTPGHATNKTYVDNLVTLSTSASEWVSGGSFTEGERVWSPLTYTDYRAKTTHSGLTTDPSLDTTNWQSASGLLPSNNLSDVADVATARTNLGVENATLAGLHANALSF